MELTFQFGEKIVAHYSVTNWLNFFRKFSLYLNNFYKIFDYLSVYN